MMQIPKRTKNPQIKMKKCAVDGCNETFAGGPSSKFCALHRDPKTRGKEKTVTKTSPGDTNLVIEHDYSDVRLQKQKCALEGCHEHFDLKIYPRQYVYPKYCPAHRNEHKRKTHLTQLSGRHH